jgi:hypothetical protein
MFQVRKEALDHGTSDCCCKLYDTTEDFNNSGDSSGTKAGDNIFFEED